MQTESLTRSILHEVFYWVPEPRIIFDVGAHHGNFTLSVLEYRLNARIYAFEPNPRSYAILQDNVKDYPEVYTYPIGLGEENGFAPFYYNSFSQTDSFLPSDQTCADYEDLGLKQEGTTSILMLTLDRFCKQNAIEQIDFLKLDVQGLEKYVLLGSKELLKKHRIKIIQLEIIFSDFYIGQTQVQDILSLMTENQYDFIGLFDVHRKNGIPQWGDFIFKAKDIPTI